jgi:hypothetical protein
MKALKIFLLLLVVVSVSVSSKENSSAGKRIVDARDGLRMRETAGASGKIITVIPYKGEVLFISEKNESVTIGGITGKWTEVEWNGKRGWVFGGFLKNAGSGENAKKGKGGFRYPKAANGWHYLNGIALEWRIILENENGLYTETPCIGSDETITIHMNDNGPTIEFFGGTCGAHCSIEKIRKIKNDDGNGAWELTLRGCRSVCSGDVLEDSVMIMYYETGPDEYLPVKAGCTVWTGGFSGNTRRIYVPVENQGMFENINENCD